MVRPPVPAVSARSSAWHFALLLALPTAPRAGDYYYAMSLMWFGFLFAWAAAVVALGGVLALRLVIAGVAATRARRAVRGSHRPAECVQ